MLAPWTLLPGDANFIIIPVSVPEGLTCQEWVLIQYKDDILPV